MIRPLLDANGIGRLREAMLSAGYTREGLKDRLGPELLAAVDHLDLAAFLRGRTDVAPPTRLETWLRLFRFGEVCQEPAVAAALEPLGMADAVAAGLIEPADGGFRAALTLFPYKQWWLLSDLSPTIRPRPLPDDHVLGVGQAAITLVEATMRHPVETALDLGTGGGVQSLHLSTHATHVTATDLSMRALRFAATTAALNELDWELLHGDMTAPVAGRRFDLVVSNPPYIIGTGATGYLYRDSGRPGDALCRELISAAPDLLTPGGYLQFESNWAHLAGQDWRERLAGWVSETGMDAWIVQTGSCDPARYVTQWMNDASEPANPERRATWLDWFHEQKIEAVGSGLIILRNSQRTQPVVRVEELYQTVEGVLGDHLAGWFERQDWLRNHRTDVLSFPYRTAAGLQLRQHATLSGPGGWQVDEQLLTLRKGLGWTEEVNQTTVAVLERCDGVTPMADVIGKLAVDHELDGAELAAQTAAVIPHLVERGILVPG